MIQKQQTNVSFQMLQSFPYWKANNRCHRGHSQGSLFVGVDIEVLALTRSLIGDGLGRQVDFDFCFRIGKNRVEKLGQKRFANHHRENKVIQFIVFVDIRKKLDTTTRNP